MMNEVPEDCYPRAQNCSRQCRDCHLPEPASILANVCMLRRMKGWRISAVEVAAPWAPHQAQRRQYVREELMPANQKLVPYVSVRLLFRQLLQPLAMY